MKTHLHHPTPPDRGFTRTDLCAVLMAVALLGFIALPALARMKPHSERASCLNNLRQLGVAWLSFASENDNKVIWYVLPSEGGTAGLQQSWRHFIALSNYAHHPAIMVCPDDPAKTPARVYSGTTNGGLADLGNRAVSYFISIELTMADPRCLLAGDGRIQGGSSGTCRGAAPANLPSVPVKKWYPPGYWGKAVHNSGFGNLLFVDGSTHSVNSNGLSQAIIANPVDGNKAGCLMVPD